MSRRETDTHGSPAHAVAWILHGGELAFVGRALAALGVPFEERTGPTRAADLPRDLSLVVATPQRLIELGPALGRAAGSAATLAVCQSISRTLERRLETVGVDYLLRRPVHPEALRLLLLHVLYAGPEKRRFRRVSVGAPVRLRRGFRARPAVLLELSTAGCRLEAADRPARGERVTVILPKGVTGGRRLRLRGSVVRSHGGPDVRQPAEVAVQLDPLPERLHAALGEVMERHARGPAAWDESAPAPTDPERPLGVPPPGEARGAADAKDPADRRGGPRCRYARPVLAHLEEGGSKVLMGRDLSTGGMRVSRDAGLAVGDRLELAVFGGEGVPPLVLSSWVDRQEGAHVVIRFGELDDGARAQLEAIVASLPLTAAGGAGERGARVVSEIVARRSA